jgi:hypothetical protein
VPVLRWPVELRACERSARLSRTSRSNRAGDYVA